MGNLWDPERTIEPTLALKLIDEQFPELEAKQIREMGIGWDNTAFIVDDKLIFRFPRRQIAVNLLEEEWFFLPKLASRLPLSIPNPQWKGVPTTQFPWSFTGYPLLIGCTACHNNLSEEARNELAQPIALFLKKLHSLPIQEFPRDPSKSHHSRIDGNLINEKIKINFNELEKLELLENRNHLETIVADSQNFKEPTTSAIVHGDLYVRHLLIDESKQLAGIIDWGSVHIGDPANDIAIAHTFLPEAAHKTFRETYGKIHQNTWQLSRLRAILSGTYLILFGHYTKDSKIKREGFRTLKVLAETAYKIL